MHKVGFPEFAEQLRAGQDPYTVVARLVTGKTEITEDERNTWKRMFLSLMYGGGSYTIEMQFGIGPIEAKRMIRTFHTGWPAVRALSNRIQATAARRGYIVALDGRHLHAEPNGEHKLLNKVVQGSAAGLMKHALVEMHRHLKTREPKLESRMVSVIHDEAIFDGPVSEVESLHEEIPPLMRKGYDHVHEIVPILVDHEVSTTSWAEKLGYDEWKESVGTPTGSTTT